VLKKYKKLFIILNKETKTYRYEADFIQNNLRISLLDEDEEVEYRFLPIIDIEILNLEFEIKNLFSTIEKEFERIIKLENFQ
jgi:ribosome-binding ATPase YchF (GTP1/OBG family)